MSRPDEAALLFLLTIAPLIAAETPDDRDLAHDDGLASMAEEQVVEGQRPAAPDPGRTSASVTVIAVDERLPASADVASTLDGAAGATVRRLGGLGDWASVSIRGASSRAVQVFLDGVPLNPDGSATVNLAELPLGAFSRVEVYRSSPPPELGAAPLGGVVNLVTGEGRAPPVASVSAGSYDTSRLLLGGGWDGSAAGHPLDLQGFSEIFGTNGDFVYFDDNGTTYDGLDDALRVRDNNHKRQWTGHARARWGDEHLRLTLLDAALLRDEGLPGAGPSPATDATLSTRRNLTVAEIVAHGGSLSGRGRLWGWTRRERYDDRLGEIGTGNQHSDEHSSTVGALGHVAWLASPALVPTLTLSARRDQLRSVDLLQGETDGPHARLALGATASGNAWLLDERLVLSAAALGTLLDDRAIDGPSSQQSPLETSDHELLTRLDPRAGLLWRMRASEGLTIAWKGNLGRYFRPPDLTELFGDRGALVGNPDLVPEHGWQADLGLRLDGVSLGAMAFDADLSVFWSRSHDLITWVQTGQRVMVPINIGEARARGIEAAGNARLGPFEDSLSLTLTDAADLRDDPLYQGNQLPRVPRLELSQSLSLAWARGLPGRLGYQFSFTDGNYWDATNWYRAAPRAIHGAFASVAPAPGWTLAFDALNLTNHITEVVPRDPLHPDDGEAVVSAITDFSDYPLPGRTLLLTVRWSPPERQP